MKQWTNLDDGGVPRTLLIDNAYLLPELKKRLLSRLAQQFKACDNTPYGKVCVKTADDVIFALNDQCFCRIVTLNSSNLSPSTRHYRLRLARIQNRENKIFFCKSVQKHVNQEIVILTIFCDRVPCRPC